MALPGKVSLKKAIEAHGGMIAEIARYYEVTRVTIYNWLDHYDLRAEVTRARHAMREVAQDITYQMLMSDELPVQWEAARFVLLHLKNDGSLMLSPETLEIMRRMGWRPEEAVAEFEALIRAEADKVEKS